MKLERELGLDGARGIEFQRALEVRDDTEARVFTDLPREIQERRKKQWPKFKKAREEAKLASFDKKEPDQLYIDGHFIPM